MNDAVDRGVGESALRSDVYRRAVVLLSDGEDNISQIRAISTVIERAVAAEIPVFTIGLLFDSDDSLRLLSSSTGGRHFSVSDPGSIDSVFSSIAEILFEKGCCNVWYTTPAPAGDGTWRNVETVLVVDGDSVDVGTGGYRAPSTSSGVEIGEASAAVNIGGLAVRVVDDFIMVTIYPDVQDRAVVQIVSSAGEIVVGPVPVEPAGGRVQIALPAAGLASGLYFLHVTTDGGVSTRPVRVLN
jgi:hypothetical protein